MQNFKYAIIGGGIAGTTAAETLRAMDKKATVCIISDEPYPLYSRIAVSKKLLSGELEIGRTFLRSEEWYEKNGIVLLKGVKATGLDSAKKTVALSNGDIISFEKLLIAIGGDARRWTIPGSDNKAVHYVRTLDDGKGLLEAFKKSTNPLFVGGGFITFELCAICAKRGLKPTVLIREPYFWQIILDEDSGMIVEDVLVKNGATIIRNELATEVLAGPDPDTISGVKTDSGRIIPADFAAVCIGTAPNTELFRATGLATGHGIITDEFLQTNLPDVWAAGDCAEYNDLMLGERIIMANWANAAMQGRVAALNMSGRKTAYRLLTSYPSMEMGLSICLVGDVRNLPERKRIFRGSRAEGRRTCLIMDGSHVIGATLLNTNTDLPWITKLISGHIDISAIADKLSDPAVEIRSLIA
jgi:NAD(P)H-nitrite reductase large subunit